MALRIVVEKADPSPLRRIFTAMLQEIRMGRARVDAFNHVARLHDIDALGALVAALVAVAAIGVFATVAYYYVSFARVIALEKPMQYSVPWTSLSIVLGIAMSGIPLSWSVWANESVSSPPMGTR